MLGWKGVGLLFLAAATINTADVHPVRAVVLAGCCGALGWLVYGVTLIAKGEISWWTLVAKLGLAGFAGVAVYGFLEMEHFVRLMICATVAGTCADHLIAVAQRRLGKFLGDHDEKKD